MTVFWNVRQTFTYVTGVPAASIIALMTAVNFFVHIWSFYIAQFLENPFIFYDIMFSRIPYFVASLVLGRSVAVEITNNLS